MVGLSCIYRYEYVDSKESRNTPANFRDSGYLPGGGQQYKQ